MSKEIKLLKPSIESLKSFDDGPRTSTQSWGTSIDAQHLSGAMWSAAEGSALGSMPQHIDKTQRYQRISLLGEGGMGKVWLGWDVQLERNVAIKEPKGDAQSHQAKQLTYEAMITAKLEHPGIVDVYDVFFEKQRPHFVMPLICGQPLGNAADLHHQQHDTLSTTLVRHLLDASEAMGYAHRMGVVHRDLSPMNILIGDDGATHIIDWGLALSTSDASGGANRVGTPGYIAPEQRLGHITGPQVDVWSLGALLHHVIYGQAPEDGADVSTYNTSWPELHAIMVCALSEDSDTRYMTASHMAEDLRRWFEGNRVRAYQITPWGVMRRATRVYRKRLIAGALIIVAFLSVIGIGVLRTRQETQRALEAEALAMQREQQAQRDSLISRKSAAKLIYADAAKHAGQQDLVRAKELALKSLSTHDNPSARGLLGALAMQPHPHVQKLGLLPPCSDNLWSLTSNPDVALCHNAGLPANQALITTWNHRKKSWGWTWWGGAFGDIHSCGIAQIVSLGQRLFTTFHPHEDCNNAYIEFDLNSGEVLVHGWNHENVTALPSSGGMRADWRQQGLLDYPESQELCPAKILNAHQDKKGHLWVICDSYEVWRLSAGDSTFELMPISPKDSAHSLASTTAHDELWIMSSQGRLFAFGETHLSWGFGESAKEMMFLPNSSLLVILGMRGTLRVFDTALQRWRFTMPGKYNDIQVDEGLSVRAIRQDLTIMQWTFSPQPRIGRYQGPAGFSMAAWSRDQDLILGVDGSGYAHMFAPFDGRQWPAKVWNKNVGKWVAASQKTNTFSFVGIRSMGVHTGFIESGEFQVHVDPRYDKSQGVRKQIMLSPEDHALYLYYGASYVGVERPNTGKIEELELSNGSAPSDTDTSSRLTHVAILSAKNVVVWDWHSDDSTLVHTHDNTAQFVSVNEQGAVLVASKDEVLVFDPRQRQTAHWRVDGARILDAEWIPGQARAVLGHMDGSMTLWDTTTGQLIARGVQHTERVTKVDASGNGRWLVTTSWDGSLVVWDLDVAQRDLEVLLNAPSKM